MAIAKNMNKVSEIAEQGDDNLRNYLIIIAKNSALTIKSNNKKYILSDNMYNKKYTTNQKDIEIDIENQDSQERLFELIKTLDEKYSSVLILKYFYGMKNEEIANHLGITKSNVNTRFVRAKEKLKKLMEKEGFYDKQTI